MIKKIYFPIFLSFILSGNLLSQGNLVPNPSFETGPGMPYCLVPTNEIENFIDSWANADLSEPCIGSCSSTDWVDYSCPGTFTNPLNTPRFIHCVKDEGIRSILLQNLIAGHTYTLRFQFASGSAATKARIFLTKFSTHWNANPSTTQNAKIELVEVNSAADMPNYSPLSWTLITRQFTVPANITGLANIIFRSESSEAVNTIWIDDVELIHEGCCPLIKQYENTINLPSETKVVNYIIAGFDSGIPNTSGNVTVLTGQSVLFQAGNQIILNRGFSTQTNSNFLAKIAPCDNFAGGIGDIDVAFLPNVFTPNGDAMNDNLCFTTTGAQNYSITVFNSFGGIVFSGNGFVSSNFVCVWDGVCNGNSCISGQIVSDGTYFYILTLFNCDNSEEFASFVSVFTKQGEREIAIHNIPAESEVPRQIILPNPAKDEFSINYIQFMPNQIRVTDIFGKIYFTASAYSTSYNFKIELLPGIYFVESADRDGNVLVDKLVIH